MTNAFGRGFLRRIERLERAPCPPAEFCRISRHYRETGELPRNRHLAIKVQHWEAAIVGAQLMTFGKVEEYAVEIARNPFLARFRPRPPGEGEPIDSEVAGAEP